MDLEDLRLPENEAWTRVDPWTVKVPRAEGLSQLAALLERAVSQAI